MIRMENEETIRLIESAENVVEARLSDHQAQKGIAGHTPGCFSGKM